MIHVYHILDGSWRTANCGIKAGFICKKSNKAIGSVTIAPTPVVPGYCPSGYHSSHNGREISDKLHSIVTQYWK